MARFASGKHALGICDKCGFQYPYLKLRKQWNGLKACPECFDIKHPQLTLNPPIDKIALHDPRPGDHGRDDARVRMVFGLTTPFSQGYLPHQSPFLYPTPEGFISVFSLGGVSFVIDNYPSIAGVSSPFSEGDPSFILQEPSDSFSVPLSIGSVTVTAISGWGADSWGDGEYGV